MITTIARHPAYSRPVLQDILEKRFRELGAVSLVDSISRINSALGDGRCWPGKIIVLRATFDIKPIVDRSQDLRNRID